MSFELVVQLPSVGVSIRVPDLPTQKLIVFPLSLIHRAIIQPQHSPSVFPVVHPKSLIFSLQGLKLPLTLFPIHVPVSFVKYILVVVVTSATILLPIHPFALVDYLGLSPIYEPMQSAWPMHQPLPEITPVLETLFLELVASIPMGFLLVLCLVVSPLTDVLILVLEGVCLFFCPGSRPVCFLHPDILWAPQGSKVILKFVGWFSVTITHVFGSLWSRTEELLGLDGVKFPFGFDHVGGNDGLLGTDFFEHGGRLVDVVVFTQGWVVLTHYFFNLL